MAQRPAVETAEEVEHLVRCGETLEAIGPRLGHQPDSLRKLLRRLGRDDVLALAVPRQERAPLPWKGRPAADVDDRPALPSETLAAARRYLRRRGASDLLGMLGVDDERGASGG